MEYWSLILVSAVFAVVVAKFLDIFGSKDQVKSYQLLQVSIPKKLTNPTPSEILDDPCVRDLKDPNTIVCYDPATGGILGRQKVTSPDQVKSIVEKAREAQVEYAKTSFSTRRAILQTLLDWIVVNQDTICQMASLDSGKTIIDANFGEILPTCEKLRWTIAHGEEALKSEYRKPGMIMAHKVPRIDYIPVGVMGCIVSWNYPFHNVIGPVISALMAGNACVVKCSEQVAWCTDFLQSLITSVLELYDINPALVRFINGYAETGQALVETADKITFIGSPGVGKIIMKNASHTLTPVILELGGKDCALVFEDSDYEQFRTNSQRYAFQNSGQNCAGLERVIIHSKLYDRYIADMAEIISNMRIGPPALEQVDLGAITMRSQLDIIQSLIDDAVSKGARVIVGGKRFIHPQYPKGQFYLPTLLAGVTLDMRIAHEEVFGPVLIVMKFEKEEEAIALANSSEFGLGSGVFTLDMEKAERVARKIKAGFTNINDFGVNYLCQGLPFGGVKTSGVDCFAGVEGLRGNCYPKAVTNDKFGFIGVRTRLPALLQYPIHPLGPLFQETLIRLLYTSEWITRLKSLFDVMRFSATKAV